MKSISKSKNVPILVFITIILVTTSVLSLLFIASQLHHEESRHTFVFSTTGKDTTTPAERNFAKQFSDSVVFRQNLPRFEVRVQDDDENNEEEDDESLPHVIDSTGAIGNYYHSLIDKDSSKIDENNTNNTPSFCFSRFSTCIQSCLLPSHDTRRVNKFLSVFHSKRYKEPIQQLLREVSNTTSDEHDDDDDKKIIHVSVSDVESLICSNNKNNNNNPVGFWFCTEQCRFVGASEEDEDKKSIYFETRFVEGGPRFCF